MSQLLREHAESQFADELAALQQADNRERPANWALSPWAVVTYLMGGKLDSGFTISAKYIGNRRLMETAVSTLTTDRALLLFGVPLVLLLGFGAAGNALAGTEGMIGGGGFGLALAYALVWILRRSILRVRAEITENSE